MNIKTTTLGLLSTTVLALAVSAGAQAQTAASAAATSTTASAKKLSHKDSSFLKDAAEAGNAEVEGSKLAVAQSSSADVKTFAQMMIDDHSKAGDELKALAASHDVKVSDKPSMLKQAELKLLSKRKAASFDQHYAEAIGVKAHEDTIKLFQKEADKGDDADVKSFAAKTLPTLTHHLELALNLKTKTDAESKK